MSLFFNDSVEKELQDFGYSTDYKYTVEEKQKFAAELLKFKPGEELEAAIAVFGSSKEQLGRASYAAAYWPKDREVIEFQQKVVKEKGIGTFLATKDETAFRIWQWTEGPLTKERIDAMKLYCDVMKYVSKTDTAIQVNVLNKVMEVPVSVSDEEWEREAASSQQKLIADTMAIAVH